MITKFTKDRGNAYYNFFELSWLFIVTEVIETLSYLGIYNPVNATINNRKLIWFFILGTSIFSFCALISIACISIIIKGF